jgi:hypothetical protein
MGEIRTPLQRPHLEQAAEVRLHALVIGSWAHDLEKPPVEREARTAVIAAGLEEALVVRPRQAVQADDRVVPSAVFVLERDRCRWRGHRALLHRS